MKELEDDYEEFVDETIKDPFTFWEKKQKEILINIIDYNLETITDLIDKENIEISTELERRNDALQSALNSSQNLSYFALGIAIITVLLMFVQTYRKRTV